MHQCLSTNSLFQLPTCETINYQISPTHESIKVANQNLSIQNKRKKKQNRTDTLSIRMKIQDFEKK